MPRKPLPPKDAALDAALRGMFRRLQVRVLPGKLLSVVDQLDEGEALRAKRVG